MLKGSELSRITIAVFLAFSISIASGEPVTPAALLSADQSPPRIALIIDDLGNWRSAGVRAVSLPGPVACAVLPHTPFAALIAERAHIAGKDCIKYLLKLWIHCFLLVESNDT
jgi:hypothetical protein